MELRKNKKHKFNIGTCECPKCFNEVEKPFNNGESHYRVCSKCNHQFYYQYSGGEINGFFTVSRNDALDQTLKR